MDLLHLVDRLEELVAGAQKMPIGNRAILDRRRLLDVVDQMRIAVPQEVREAQDIVAHRDVIRREAEEEGRILLAQAEERAARLVETHEITQAARQRAEEIATESEARLEDRIAEANADIQQRIQESRQIAREQMSAADEYARELLLRLQRQLEAFVSSVRNGIDQLEPEAPTLRRGAAAPIASAPVARSTRDDRRDAREEQDPITRASREMQAERSERIERTDRTERTERATEFEGDLSYGLPLSEPRSSSRNPTPLRREDEGEELENLLRPRQGELPQRQPAVIDDFEHEPLDDDPLLSPRRDERPCDRRSDRDGGVE